MSWHDPETHHEPVPAPSPWHPVNIGHLVMGVAFVGLALVWLLVASDAVDLADARWLLPAPWLAAGAAGLLAAAFRGRPGGRRGGASGTMAG
jgi:hypothetical protein